MDTSGKKPEGVSAGTRAVSAMETCLGTIRQAHSGLIQDVVMDVLEAADDYIALRDVKPGYHASPEGKRLNEAVKAYRASVG